MRIKRKERTRWKIKMGKSIHRKKTIKIKKTNKKMLPRLPNKMWGKKKTKNSKVITMNRMGEIK